MGRPGPQTQGKRRREQAKREKRRAKDERRAARKIAKSANKSADRTDPDGASESHAEEPTPTGLPIKR
jgi:hypothetical protein